MRIGQLEDGCCEKRTKSFCMLFVQQNHFQPIRSDFFPLCYAVRVLFSVGLFRFWFACMDEAHTSLVEQ